MDETEVNRLRKVYRLTESPIESEAVAALMMTKTLLAKHGKRMSDLPEILNGQATGRRSTTSDIFREAEEAMRERMDAINRRTEAFLRKMKEQDRQDEARRARDKQQQEAARRKAKAFVAAERARIDEILAKRREPGRALDRSIRARIQIQEEAVAAGFAPKDVISYARGKLVALIRTRAEQGTSKVRRRKAA